jgi:hypothetical protein
LSKAPSSSPSSRSMRSTSAFTPERSIRA